jgi:hypothetical protein
VSASIWAEIHKIEQTEGIYRTTLTRLALERYLADRHPPFAMSSGATFGICDRSAIADRFGSNTGDGRRGSGSHTSDKYSKAAGLRSRVRERRARSN